MRHLPLFVALSVLGVVLLSGCGGGGGGDLVGNGSVGIKVVWPPQAKGLDPKLVPAASNSIKVQVFAADGLTLQGEKTIPRPQDTAKIEGVTAGNAILRATGYPTLNGTGVAQATAEIAILVEANLYKEWPITMASTIHHVDVSPNPALVQAGKQRQLYATAKNAAGQTVLVAPTNAFTWSQVDGADKATVDANGLVSAIAPGAATVKAEEKESHLSGTGVVSVVSSVLQADLATALAVPLPTAPEPGSPANVAMLADWQNRKHVTEAELRAELAKFIAAATANPNDSAAQLGLALTILPIASNDAAAWIGDDVLKGLDIISTQKLALASQVRADKLATMALQTVSLKSTPRIPSVGATSAGKLQARSVPPVADIVQYREAMRDFMLPALNNVKDRFAAIADLATPSVKLMSIDITDGAKTYTLYAADFDCLAAAIQFVRTAALMAYAIDPDYGNYNWNLDLKERDLNDDGMITVDEYAPAAPFSNLEPVSWSAAGDALANAVDRMAAAVQKRPIGDANDGVNRIVADQNLTNINAYLADAHNLLAGEVSVTARWTKWVNEAGGGGANPPVGAAQKVAKHQTSGTLAIPLNLRQIWQDPPASFRALLPSLYLMFDSEWGMGTWQNTGATLTVNLAQWGVWDGSNWVDPQDDLIAGTKQYTLEIVSESGSLNQLVTVQIAAAPHNLTVAAQDGFTGAQLQANADWSVLRGTINGTQVSLNRQVNPWEGDVVSPYTTWNDIPDRTLSGLFPDPEKVKELVQGQYDTVSFKYNSLSINDDSALPVFGAN